MILEQLRGLWTLRYNALLLLSGSEELDVVSMDPGDAEDLPLHTPAYEELMEVITHAVAQLNIDWPAERQEVCQKSKPPCRGLLFFFPNLHTPHYTTLSRSLIWYIVTTLHIVWVTNETTCMHFIFYLHMFSSIYM